MEYKEAVSYLCDYTDLQTGSSSIYTDVEHDYFPGKSSPIWVYRTMLVSSKILAQWLNESVEIA